MSFQDLKRAKQARQATRIGKQGPESIATGSEIEPRLNPAIADIPYSLPEGIAVRQSETRGRGLFTSKRYRAGSRILNAQPVTYAISSSHLSSYCSNCSLSPAEKAILTNNEATIKSLKRCTNCRVVHYCSVECQRADWVNHKEECAAHKKLRSIYNQKIGDASDRWIMSEALRALGRLCWARKRARAEKGEPPWASHARKSGCALLTYCQWAEVDAMESHVKRLPEAKVMELANQVQHLRQYLAAASSSSREPAAADMADFGFSQTSQLLNLLSAFQVNSFTLASPSLSPIGVAMSPVVALCNHSCEPNAVVVFPKGAAHGMKVIAIRDIAPEEEILTSYVDVSLPATDRHSDLKERYGFDCDCPLCRRSSQADWADPRWCALHSGCKRGLGTARMPDLSPSALRKLQCASCSQIFVPDIAELGALVKKGKALLADDEAGRLDPQKALTTLSKLVPALLAFMPPSSHPVLALLRLYALLLTPPTSPAMLARAISSLAMASAGAHAVHPPNHPTLALILAEWGKLLTMELDEKASRADIAKRLTEAIIVLRKAFEACEKGFGPGGGIVGKEMEGLIMGCQGEAGLVQSL